MFDLLISLALAKQVTSANFLGEVEEQIQYFGYSANIKREALRRLSANPDRTFDAGRKYCLFRYSGGTDAQLQRSFTSTMAAELVNGRISQREVEIRTVVTLAPQWAAKEVLCPQFK